MKKLKQAVEYYIKCYPESTWEDFYDKLEEARAYKGRDNKELWLIHELLLVVSMPIDEILAAKDSVKGEHASDARKNAGEFFTPLIWAKEGMKYLDKHIGDWSNYYMWDGCCGTGNLLREAGVPNENKFLSTLEESDIRGILADEAFSGVTAFPLDFLSGLDYDMVNTEFMDKLPTNLRTIIEEDKPLIMYFNPPYKGGMAKATDVGRYMGDIGLGDSAYDLFYQCVWRIVHIVEAYELKNTYLCIFGPLTLFSGTKAQGINKELQSLFDFVDGMCLPAGAFSDTSNSINWGIGCTLWKAKGFRDNIETPKGVVLEKKEIIDGQITKVGETLYSAPRVNIASWLQPKDVMFYKEEPVVTSSLTFKGSKEFELVGKYGGKIAENALGVMMVDDNLARGCLYSGVLTLPTSINYVSITEENFWRCVSNFVFRHTAVAGWADTRKWNSAPDVTVEGYDEWVTDGLALFLCEGKSMQASYRGIDWCGEKLDVLNKLFLASPAEVAEKCNDTKILADLEQYGDTGSNDFLLGVLDDVRRRWSPESEELYNWCKNYILYTLNHRGGIDYAGSTVAWDAGLAQIRRVLFADDLNNELFKRQSAVRNKLAKSVMKFGFIPE